MNVIDKKLKGNVGKYLLQCLLAATALAIVLGFLDAAKQTAILASFGASTLVVFTMPHMAMAKARKVVGGYAVGIAVGCVFHYVAVGPWVAEHAMYRRLSLIAFGAFSVGLAILIMVVTNTEHAPAAGMALALVFGEWSVTTILVIFSAVVLLALIHRLLKRKLINLI